MYQGLNPSTPYCYAQHLPIEPAPRPVANLTSELGFIVIPVAGIDPFAIKIPLPGLQPWKGRSRCRDRSHYTAAKQCSRCSVACTSIKCYDFI